MDTETKSPVLEEQLTGLEWVLYSLSMAFVQLSGWVLAAAAYLCSNNPWHSPRVSKMLRQGKSLISQLWSWLECPAPDRPQPVEDPSSLGHRIVTALAVVAITFAVIGLAVVMIISTK